MKLLAALTLFSTLGAIDCSFYPFMNISLSFDERVNDIVQRLTLDELTEQMARGGRTTFAPPIERLNIKPYSWGTECLRGDSDAGPATSFAQALGLASSFSREVIWEVSRATGFEVRAKFNNYTAAGQYGQHKGASCWSPVINIHRDPRWGRNTETYGEDPWMSGELAKAYVRGLQGDHEKYILANAGCKHFDAYGGPENIPESRHQFNAKVSMQDWRQTFLPQFRACVEAGTLSLMCSYNRINGIPACANKFLLTDILRNEWGFRGYVISDEGAIEDIKDNHHYTKTIPETAAAAVNAGCNLEDGPDGIKPYFTGISAAVTQGLLSMNKVREAAKPMFYTRMRLGLFDPPSENPYTKLKPKDFIQSERHRYISLITAMKSFVLLKNNGALPLTRKYKTTGIVGPFADNLYKIYGEYSAVIDPKYAKTPRQGLVNMTDNLQYKAGCLEPKCTDYNSNSVKDAVNGAEIVVVCLGLSADLEGEGNDRSNINLPGKQLQLLKDAISFAPKGAKVILVLFNSGPLDVSWAQENSNVSAILGAGYPAQATGDALYNVFYNKGEASNPAGRLPATWPRSLANYPNITDYTMAGRTYRYPSQYAPLYPFGYGLSYTRFYYSSLTITPSISKFPNSLRVRVFVTNVGPMDGEEVVQIYSVPDNPLKGAPIIQLVGFDRVFVKKGEARMVDFTVKRDQLSVWQNDRFIIPRGSYTFYAGGQQPMQKQRVESNILSKKIVIA